MMNTEESQWDDDPMNDELLPTKHLNYLFIWRVYLVFGILQSILAIVNMLLAQTASESALLFGLSGSRLALALVVTIVLWLFIGLLVETWLAPKRVTQRLAKLNHFISQPLVWATFLLVIGATFLIGSYFITLTPEISEPFTQAYFIRLFPLVIWITGLSAQSLIALVLIQYGSKPGILLLNGKVFYITLILVGGIFLTWFWIGRGIIPHERAHSGLNHLGAPIIGTQLLLAWGIGVVVLALGFALTRFNEKWGWLQRLKPDKVDIIICIGLWLATVIIWQNMPIKPNWFINEPLPPNYEYYPTSDARVYDLTTQLAMVGEGFQFYYSPYVRRPLHAAYLTTLHLLGGQDYETVVFLQVLVLAWLPSFIYLLTKSLHNRISGVIAGVLILLREANAIAIGGNVTTSHAKLYMVDLPITLGVVVFMYLVLRWLKGLEKGIVLGLVSGGCLGLAMLIRLETFVFFFPLIVILSILLFPKKKYTLWFKHTVLFILGMALVISPWVWRNWQKTGLIYIDSPVFYYGLIAVRFRPVTTEAPPLPSEEEMEESFEANPGLFPTAETEHTPASTPIPIDEGSSPEPDNPVKEAANRAIAYIQSNSKQIMGFIITHYLNSQIQTFLILPTSFRSMDAMVGFMGHKSPERLWEACCSVQNYVRRMPYWQDWDGTFPRQTIVPLIGIFILFALGINESWKKGKIIGLTPALLGTTYLLFNALFRNSGGRYILPVDWTGVVYYSIGLAYVTTSIIQFIKPVHKNALINPSRSLNSQNIKTSRSALFLTAAGLFLLGCSIPIFEASFQQRYTPIRQETMLASLYQSDLITVEEQNEIKNFLSQDGTIIAGRGIYPRYFPANVGEAGKKKGILGPQPYPRLVFHVVGPSSPKIALPLGHQPEFFPNASDVLIIGCTDQEALAVVVYDSSNSPEAIYWRSPMPSKLTCPLPVEQTESD